MTGTLNLKRMFGNVAEVGGLFPSAYTIGDDRSFAITRLVNDVIESMLFFNKNGLGLYDGKSDYSYFSRIIKGTYTGDGESEQFIDLGFTPTAVLSTSGNGRITISDAQNAGRAYVYGGLAINGLTANNYTVAIKENGFVVVSKTGLNGGYTQYKANQDGDLYCYIAVR